MATRVALLCGGTAHRSALVVVETLMVAIGPAGAVATALLGHRAQRP